MHTKAGEVVVPPWFFGDGGHGAAYRSPPRPSRPSRADARVAALSTHDRSAALVDAYGEAWDTLAECRP
jgi:hypothetical protein